MSKFTTPVSMQVTQEQYEKDLKESLKKLGYNELVVALCETFPILVSNLFGNKGELGISSEAKEKYNRHFIDHYNPTLFLALAAMSNEKDGIAGEYWVCTDPGDEDFTKDKLYKANSSTHKGFAFPKDGGGDNGWSTDNHNHFRKATKEELINHFTKENVFSTNKTDMKKDTIIGYKLTKPEYEEAIRNLVKTQITNYKKERDLTIKSNYHSIGLLEKAGVLSLWFTPVYKQQEQIFKVGNFEVKVKDGKVFHKNENITDYVKDLVDYYNNTKPLFGSNHYKAIIEDITFSKNGCENGGSKLSEWKAVYNALNK